MRAKTMATSKAKILAQSSNDFDWALYENGYHGGTSLKINKKVKASGHDKVFCHEANAQELYDMYDNWFNNKGEIMSKDNTKGATCLVNDLHVISDHEISIDCDFGMSAVIDLNKEKEYLNTLNCNSVHNFITAVKADPEYKQAVINTGVIGKVVENGRISLWEGHLSKIEYEFMEQVKHPENINCAYNAKIESINGGGFIVNILGVQCFLPGSLAAAGILTDFESMLGKTVPVIVINYIDKSNCFVVSYKKYLEMILPKKIETELEIGQEVMVKVTGASKNGLFCQFKDNAGEWVFSGLVHRSVMSSEFEKRFDDKEFRSGDEMRMYIANLIEKDGQYRIVLTDSKTQIPIESDSSTGVE